MKISPRKISTNYPKKIIEENHYSTLINKRIENDILLTEGENLTIKIPDVNSILGDKLTAFAPHTTGIEFGRNKELEIIKQLFDCCMLLREMTSFHDVKNVYERVAVTELGYRGKSLDVKTVLKDTISSCFCIISKGKNNRNEYTYFVDGIRRIGGHIYGEKFNGKIAARIACEVLYLAACIYANHEYTVIDELEKRTCRKLSFRGAKSVNYLQVTDPKSFAYLSAAVEILGEEIEDILYIEW